MTKNKILESQEKKYPNLTYEEKILYTDGYHDGYKAGVDDMAKKLEEKNERKRSTENS